MCLVLVKYGFIIHGHLFSEVLEIMSSSVQNFALDEKTCIAGKASIYHTLIISLLSLIFTGKGMDN